MLLLVWFALALSMVLATTGAVILFRRARALWRDAKRFQLALTLRLDGLAYQVEELSLAAEIVPAQAPAIENSVGRLRLTLARLDVLTGALRDVQSAVGRVTAVYPRKASTR